MEWLFGKKKTPEELMKENQRLLKRSMRELDRERQRLEREEKKTLADIKKAAKAGQVQSAKILAKDVVRTRRFQQRLMIMKTQIQGVSHKIMTLKATNGMARAMAGVTKAMGRMNKSMNLPALQQIMAEFEKQSTLMDDKQEMMEEAIDDAVGDEEDEEETEELVSKVFDELGLDVSGSLANVPVGGKQETVADAATNDLEARLANLTRD